MFPHGKFGKNGLMRILSVASFLGTIIVDAQLRGHASKSRPTIPQIVWFTYPSNIIATRSPPEYYENVLNTANTYRNAWGQQLAPVNFVHPAMCISMIERIEHDLVQYYKEETVPDLREDICKLAVLYQNGGYYFNIDTQAVEPYRPDNSVTFAATLVCEGKCFLTNFIATSKKNPILKQALHNILEAYNEGRDKTLRASYAIGDAYLALPKEDRQNVQIMEEARLDDGDGEEASVYPMLERQEGSGMCNYIIHDPVAEVAYFYTRFLGSPHCQKKQPESESESELGTIPRMMWFSYGHDILERKEPPALYDNVLNTVKLYRESWGDEGSWAPIKFLDDSQCLEKINAAAPDLVPYFEGENNGALKGDICSIATLYVHGGYYIDVDMQVVEPYTPSDKTSFVSTVSCNGGCLDRSFFASAPEHPVLEKALDNMLQILRNNDDTTMMGSVSLGNAFQALPDASRENVHVLDYGQLDVGPNPQNYPHIVRQHGKGTCNFVVHDAYAHKLYFFASLIGYGGCQPLQEGEEIA